jgi:2-isopropylmalate synthase
LFNQTYLSTADRWQLGNYELSRRDGSDGLEVTLHGPDGELNLGGKGNGVVDAFVQAMEAFTGRHIVVVEYSEHTLGQSADAEAVCYVQLNIDGERPCGVGRSHDIVQASLAAILSALDGRGLVFAHAA